LLYVGVLQRGIKVCFFQGCQVLMFYYFGLGNPAFICIGSLPPTLMAGRGHSFVRSKKNCLFSFQLTKEEKYSKIRKVKYLNRNVFKQWQLTNILTFWLQKNATQKSQKRVKLKYLVQNSPNFLSKFLIFFVTLGLKILRL